MTATKGGGDLRTTEANQPQLHHAALLLGQAFQGALHRGAQLVPHRHVVEIRLVDHQITSQNQWVGNGGIPADVEDDVVGDGKQP